MVTKLRLLLATLLVALVIPAVAQAKTYYWISHGSPADPAHAALHAPSARAAAAVVLMTRIAAS